MSERRRQPRFEICLDVVIEGDAVNRSARVADVSEGGCYIDFLGEAYPGEVLHLKIKLPTGEWIELLAQVAHYTPRLGMGLRFIELDQRVRDKIRLLVRQLRDRDGLGTQRTALGS